MEKRTPNFCPKCGNKLEGNEKFCNVCGFNLLEESDDVSRSEQIEKPNVIATPIQQEENKPNRKQKKILIGAGAIVVILVLLSVLGNMGSSNETDSSDAVSESSVGSEVETKDSELDESETLVEEQETEAISETVRLLEHFGENLDPRFSMTDEQKNFIDTHLNIFPTAADNMDALSSLLDYSLDYSHLIKNPQSYVGKLAYINGTVTQIIEEKIPDSDLGFITRINMVDGDGNFYFVYYIGNSTSLVENAPIQVNAMPIEYSSYKNLNDEGVLTLVMLAATVETYDTSWAAGSDEPDYGWEEEQYVFPGSDYRWYSERELEGYPKETLRLGRNEIYARHGRIFEAEDLKQYFESKSWYHGYLTADEFDDSVLNQYERDNLELFKRMEDMQ